MTLAAALGSARPWVGCCRCTRACARLPRKPTCLTVSSTGGAANTWATAVLLLASSSCAAGELAAVGGGASAPMAIAGVASVSGVGDALAGDAAAGGGLRSEAGLLWGPEVWVGVEAAGSVDCDKEAGAAGCDESVWGGASEAAAKPKGRCMMLACWYSGCSAAGSSLMNATKAFSAASAICISQEMLQQSCLFILCHMLELSSNKVLTHRDARIADILS